MRLVILFALPFPPADDTGQQLYATHLWLGTAFPAPSITAWQLPPGYYFLFLIPFTYAFPVFTGSTLLIGIVPALLVFPTYWFLRKAGTGVPAAAFGGALLASAASISAMVSWNGGYNAAGLLFAVFFFGEFLAYLKSPNRRDLVLSSLLFAAVGATHFLSFLFVVLALFLTGGFALVLVPRRRETLKVLGYAVLGCVIASLALVPIYYNLLRTVVNVGPASGAFPPDLLAILLPNAWGFGFWNESALAAVDVAVTLVAFGTVLLLRLRDPVVSLLLGMVAAALIITVADVGNYTRGVLFLLVPICIAVALFGELVYSRFAAAPGPPTPEGSHDEGGTPNSSPSPRSPMAHRRVPRVALPALAGTLAAAFLLVNATYSYSTMSTSSDYYLTLNNENVDLLNWLADHTNSTARILLASPALTSWVQGYSNRLAFSPVPFNLVITSASYSVANSGWLMAMGQYVSGNGYMAVGENLPAWDSDPAIYLLTPYGWTTLENANSGDVHFEVRERNTTLRLTTENAVVTAANLSSPCAGCSGQNLTLSWPWTGVVISQTVEVVGQTAVLRWTGEVGTLLSTELRMAMPPSNYQGLEHEDVPDVASAARLSDRFTLYGNPLSVTISGANGEFNQTTVPDGWTYINYTGGSRLTWSMNGLRPTAGKTPFSLTASSLVRQLDVSYLVADSTDFFPGFGYSLYLRCTTPDGFGGIVAREAYLNDGLYVFHLT